MVANLRIVFMDNNFELPISLNGEEILLNAVFKPWGYTYRIEVQVSGSPLFFERDEENNFRAVVYGEDPGIHPGAALLEAIAGALQQAFS
jgi:hypothetical protein